ncbi:hypothetical protein [Nocardioides halotolerans]|jgi:hypothetical protein|uniref:hypothetical protein n=1 Tax=Nocardioides halotolerans TaxID=433660 RepID=UPI000418C3BF|nr:hypothetical protein [Nocardioides halotolerans]
MEILEAGFSGAEGAVFVVVVGGRRIELPWVEYASLRDGILVLESASPGSGSAPVTWVRVWDQASWQLSLGEEANAAPAGRRVRAPEPEAEG